MPTLTDRQYSKKNIADIASKIRQEYFSTENPMDGLLNIIKSNRGILEVSFGVPKETLRIRGDESFVITIPANTSPLRDVFTIAHELGHYYLHSDKRTKESFNRDGTNQRETEANWFAAELLMPAEKFKKTAEELQNDPQKIAAKFGVSGAAARVRMSVLGLI